MAYTQVNGRAVYVPDDIRTPEQNAQQIERGSNAIGAVAGQAIKPNVPVTPQETLDAAKKKVAPMPSYQDVHTDVTVPAVPKTEQDRINGISNAYDLESALAAAREDADRETWVQKRLANKAYWDSIASTVGALGKFAVVGTSPDGRDVTTGDPAEGSRVAYDQAAKRRDAAVAKLEAVQKEGRTYENALAQLAEKMRIQREQQAQRYKEQKELADYKARLEAGLIDARTNAGIRRDDNASGNRQVEIGMRGQNQMAGIGARNAQQDKNNEFRHNERVETQEWKSEENAKKQEADAAKAANKGGGTVTRGGGRVTPEGGSQEGKGTKKAKYNFKQNNQTEKKNKKNLQ